MTVLTDISAAATAGVIRKPVPNVIPADVTPVSSSTWT